MSILCLLVPLAMGLSGAAVAGFFWAVRHGEFDDVETPKWRILMGEEEEER